MSGGIFVSYRRDDSRHAAGRLADRIGHTFSRDQLFIDVDNIDLGLDFVKVLQEKVSACDVMLVVIGPSWLNSADERGNRRLDNPRDFVRLEIEEALKRDVRVIPILVDGAEMPRAEYLPDSLQSLVNRQATTINHERFGADVERIVESLKRIVFQRMVARDSSYAPSTVSPIPRNGNNVKNFSSSVWISLFYTAVGAFCILLFWLIASRSSSGWGLPILVVGIVSLIVAFTRGSK